jgi:hypothetical protein
MAVGLGIAAFVLGVLAFVRREDIRVCAAAAMLGVVGLAFEQLAVALVALVISVVAMIALSQRS